MGHLHYLHPMPEFCDVALPVPLDIVFTYSIPPNSTPVVGGRVLVPFRQKRMTGVVVELHDRKPSVQAKSILSVLDLTPVLDDQLLQLGRWISNYYLAPLGEVFRTMLPLSAEFKRSIAYRITDEGLKALHLAGMSGSSARSRRTPEEQAAEFRVLDCLAAHVSETTSISAINESRVPHVSPPLRDMGAAPSDIHDFVREQTLRSATGGSRSILNGMVRKGWVAREDVSAAQDATRTEKIAILKLAEGKLNPNQRTLIDTLAALGGRTPVATLQSLEVPRATLKTLVKRGLVEIIENPADFSVSQTKPRPSPFAFEFNEAQKSALSQLRERVNARRFSGMLLHGVTGSGKTAVYLAAMRAVLESGRSAILLVPEIGLTPAVAADLHQIFGSEVAILHSALSDKERAEQ